MLQSQLPSGTEQRVAVHAGHQGPGNILTSDQADLVGFFFSPQSGNKTKPVKMACKYTSNCVLLLC